MVGLPSLTEIANTQSMIQMTVGTENVGYVSYHDLRLFYIVKAANFVFGSFLWSLNGSSEQFNATYFKDKPLS
jgi:hypothetical protein